jgi:wobble nucleotide-excising tRNase
MVSHITLFSNVGQFEAVAPGPQLPFSRMSILYAENGRGKSIHPARAAAVSDAFYEL